MTHRQIHITFYLLALAAFLGFRCAAKGTATPHTKIKYYSKAPLRKLPEPSDIVYDETAQHFFIVSDHGKLFECDTNGAIITKAAKEGYDFEGIECKGGRLYVSDETMRKVYQYTKDGMVFEKQDQVTWNGAPNKGYESIAWNPAKGCFVMISESPAVIVEYSEAFTELNRLPFAHTRDISSARFHNGYMYLLSDLEHCIIRCDATTYQPLHVYSFDILNPEGFAFGPHDNLFVISDNAQKLYKFAQLTLP
jgi:uncharacterized protein YjiK